MSATTKTDHALERLIFFSDAVFAIAITLLVIEVRVPELTKGSPDRLYWNALHELIPSLVGYFISFAVIGVFWVGHHRAFTLASRYSQRILAPNMVLLGLIAFMPFTTAFLTHNMGQRVPVFVYCTALLAAAAVNILVVRTATGPAMVDPAADAAAILQVRRRSIGIMLGALTGLVIGWFEPRYGHLALASIGLWRRILTRSLR